LILCGDVFDVIFDDDDDVLFSRNTRA